MDLKVLAKEKDSLKIEVTNPDDTVIYPLINELLADDKVEDARYITGHPLLDKPSILIRVKEGRPQTALKRAAERLAERYQSIRTMLQASTK